MADMEKENVRPIEEVLIELAKEIPQEEWDRLPDDLNDNLDHYLYGGPKNKTRNDEPIFRRKQ